MPKLTTTSFALLGLLGRQAWSAYALTKFMRHSILRAIWPRAESHIYSECKNLEQRGLVDATQKSNGKRKRTEYVINQSGREALQAWLAQAAQSRFLIESESLARLVNAEDHEQLLMLLRGFQDEALQDAAWTREEIARYLDGSWPVPAGRGNNAMVTSLLVDMTACRLRWAREMEARLGDSAALDDSDETLELYTQIDSRLAEIVEG